MKNLFKTVFLLLGVFAITFSCQKESLKEEEQSFKPTLRVLKVDQNFINQNPLLKEKLAELSPKNKKGQSNSYSRIIYNEEHNFSIDTDNVTYIEYGNYHSYTFSMLSESDLLQNLVVTFDESLNDYNVLIVEYDLTIEEETILHQGGIVNSLVNKLSFKPLNNFDVISIFNRGDLPQGIYRRADGSCYSPDNFEFFDNGTFTYDQIDVDCAPESDNAEIVEAGGGGGGETDPNNNNNNNDTNNDNDDDWEPDNNTGGGVNNGNDDEDNENSAITAPTIPNYAQSILSCINGNELGIVVQTDNTTIDPNILDSVDLTNQKLINVYLNQNGCSEEAQEFAILAAEAIADGGEVDFEENIIYDNSLDNYPCHKLVIQDAIGVCSPLTQAVLNIFEANDGTNLIFKVSNSISGNGNTSSSSVYDPNTSTCNITIRIRQSYLETATDLSIARTVIHESLHAIFVYMFEENLLTSPNGTALDGFADLVEAHINYLSGLPANIGVAHHTLMTDFVEDMATSLSAYGVAEGYSNSFNFYKKLCWSGAMINSPTFQSLYPQYVNPNDATNNPNNVNPEWLDIINTNAAEQDNATYTFAHPNGTTYTNSPIGNSPNANEPCN